MQDWVLIPDFNIADLRFFYSFLCNLTRKFGIDGTVMIVPLVFKIQHLIQENKIKITSRQYAIESSLISLFIVMAQFYHIPSLAEYMDYIKQTRGLRQDDIMLTESINETSMYQPESFSLDNQKENCIWIDRSLVVEIMSKEGNLRDEQDSHGLDLEAKLFAEWGSDAFRKWDIHLLYLYLTIYSPSLQPIVKKDQTIRTRILQESNDSKPKLSNPWEHSDFMVKRIRV